MESGEKRGSFGDCQVVKWIPLDHWTRGWMSCTAPLGSCQSSRETGDTSLALLALAEPVTWSMRLCLSLSSAKSGLLASKVPPSAVSLGCQAVGWSSSGAGRLLSGDLAAGEGGLCCVRDEAHAGAEASAFLLGAWAAL